MAERFPFNTVQPPVTVHLWGRLWCRRALESKAFCSILSLDRETPSEHSTIGVGLTTAQSCNFINAQEVLTQVYIRLLQSTHLSM